MNLSFNLIKLTSIFVLLAFTTSLYFTTLFTGVQVLLNGPENNAAVSLVYQTTNYPRYFTAIEHIDDLVAGNDAYKNYLRASVFNEVANANVGDDALIESLALVMRNRANVGLSQVGPSGSDAGFIDRWLEKYGYTIYDLQTNDEVNILAKDAFVVDRQIGEIAENFYYIKERFGTRCAIQPRYCDTIWTDQEALRIVTQDSGHASTERVENHHARIYNLTCNQAGSKLSDFSNHTLFNSRIIGSRNVCTQDTIITDTQLDPSLYVS